MITSDTCKVNVFKEHSLRFKFLEQSSVSVELLTKLSDSSYILMNEEYEIDDGGYNRLRSNTEMKQITMTEQMELLKPKMNNLTESIRSGRRVIPAGSKVVFSTNLG